MTGIRRALLLTSLERYVVLAVNFGVIATASRLLTPAEVGLAVVGTSLLAVAETLRDFGIGNYLVQAPDAGRERVRTAFTVMAMVSAVIVVALMAFAGPLAALYGEPGLEAYLRVVSLGFLAGPFAAPVLALLRRDMAVGAVAQINILGGLVGAVATIGLILSGMGYISFAWGGATSGVAVAGLALAKRPDWSIFRPGLADWRGALAFGGFNSATAILNGLWDVLPYLTLGRLQPAAAVGLYQRATVLCQMPDRALLAAVLRVALPALAAEVRQGRGVKEPYLRALGYITVVQWPALTLLALLAHPVVEILLGRQWLSIVPLVQVIALAQAAAFSASLTYPVLVALGGVRDTLAASLVTLPVSALILTAAAALGVEAVAASMLLILPLQAAVALGYVRRRVGFHWRELGMAVAGSGAVTLCSAVAPVLALALNGFRADLPVAAAAMAALGSALGWLAGLRLLGHPFAKEISRALRALPNIATTVPLPAWMRRVPQGAGPDKPL